MWARGEASSILHGIPCLFIYQAQREKETEQVENAKREKKANAGKSNQIKPDINTSPHTVFFSFI